MKRFLVISGVFLLGAIVATIVIFWFVIGEISGQKSASEGVVQDIATMSELGQPKVIFEEQEGDIETEPGIPLRNLPINDAQASVLSKVGIDVETFVITPKMQDCANEKLGNDRMDQIIYGSAPSVIETTKLLPCLI